MSFSFLCLPRDLRYYLLLVTNYLDLGSLLNTSIAFANILNSQFWLNKAAYDCKISVVAALHYYERKSFIYKNLSPRERYLRTLAYHRRAFPGAEKFLGIENALKCAVAIRDLKSTEYFTRKYFECHGYSEAHCYSVYNYLRMSSLEIIHKHILSKIKVDPSSYIIFDYYINGGTLIFLNPEIKLIYNIVKGYFEGRVPFEPCYNVIKARGLMDIFMKLLIDRKKFFELFIVCDNQTAQRIVQIKTIESGDVNSILSFLNTEDYDPSSICCSDFQAMEYKTSKPDFEFIMSKILKLSNRDRFLTRAHYGTRLFELCSGSIDTTTLPLLLLLNEDLRKVEYIVNHISKNSIDEFLNNSVNKIGFYPELYEFFAIRLGSLPKRRLSNIQKLKREIFG